MPADRSLRDPATFEMLAEHVFAPLLGKRKRGDSLRAWVPGCGDGREAYSLAIAFQEFIGRTGVAAKLQVFATDLDEALLEKARGGHGLEKAIREMCVFSRHDVLVDPPFARLHLIACRKLAGDRMIPLLHRALRPEGFLWTGPRSPASLAGFFEPAAAPGLYRPKRVVEPARMVEPLRETDRLLLARYSPPAVVVDGNLDILQFRGDTSAFLALAPGQASLNVMRMVRKDLLIALRGAIAQARRDGRAVHQEPLAVIPVRAGLQSGGFVICFEEKLLAPPATARKSRARPQREAGRVADLMQELETTRDQLQSVIEQYTRADEEAQAASEEMQSLNEELETSREEVQSANEELETVNQQLQGRNAELSDINADLSNLIANVQIPIVMLDWDLRIRRFTPAAGTLFNLLASDVGRPITDIRLNVEVPDLDGVFAAALRSPAGYEGEVQDRRGHWFLLRVRQYRTAGERVEGAILMLMDIDSTKRAEQALREAERVKDEYLGLLAHELRNPLAAMADAAFLVADAGLRDESVDRAIATIERQTRNMARIIDDLRDVSRIAQGGMTLVLERVDVQEAMRQALDTFEGDRVSRGLAVTARYDDAALWVDADPLRLEQMLAAVLANLLGNAPDGARLAIEAGHERGRGEGGDQVVIRLRDNAPGNPAKREGAETGLSVARNLVRLHGGTLDVRAPVADAGRELVVRFPRRDPPPGSAGGRPGKKAKAG